MSAVAAPSEAVQQEAVATEVAKAGAPQGPITLKIGEIAKGTSKAVPLWTPAADKPKEKEKEEKPVIPVEEKPVVPTEEKKPEPPVVPEIKHNREHFKKLEEDRDSWKAKFEELQKQPKAEVPEEVKVKLTDYEKRLEELQKKNEEYLQVVRETDMTRDPVYHEKYVKPIQDNMQEIFQSLVNAGVDKTEANSLVSNWNLKGISEAAADMDEVTKGLMMATIRDTIRIDKERQQQIKQPEDWSAKRRQQQEQEQQASMKQRQSMADEIYHGLLTATPVLNEEGNAPIRDAVQRELLRAAKGEMPVKELFGKIAQAEALQMAVKGQHEALVAMQAELEAAKKQLAEQDTFIKANGSGTLRTEANGGADAKDGEKYVPLTQRVVVKV